MNPPGVSRRRMLAGVATGGSAMLAGCSRASYDDRLRVEVPEVSTGGGDFTGRFVVRNSRSPGGATGTGSPEPYETTYEDVRFLGYAPDRSKVVDVAIGDLSPRSAVEESFTADAFPLVITADAKRSVVGEDDYVADRGAYIRGYLGRSEDPETSPVTGDSGHVWGELGRRELDDALPPRDVLFDRLKCRHRRLRRDDDPVNLAVVPNSDQWVERTVPDPTIHRKFWITYVDDLDDDAYSPPGTTRVRFEELPELIRTAVREERNPDWTSREEFLGIVGAILDREIGDHTELPPCSASHVVCHDTRGENCRDGGGRFTGMLGTYIWVETRYAGTRRGIVPSFEEQWKPPDASPLPPCTNDRSTEFAVTVTDSTKRLAGLDRGRRVSPVPESVRSVLEDRPEDEAYHGVPVDRERFYRFVAALERFDDPRLPDCELRHVDCSRDPRIHCGAGQREMYYKLPEGDDVRGLKAVYRWRREPEST